MKLRVLGCAGAIAAGHKTTAFLLDEDLLVDAGTGVGDLTLDELLLVDHVLITHSHLDHIATLPLLADSVMARRARDRGPIRVHALPQTLDALRQHVFNGTIWPDFTRLPAPDQAVLSLQPIEIGDDLRLGEHRIRVLSAEHTVAACGFAVRGAEGWWVYTGDTERNPRLWQELRAAPINGQIAMLIIETAFSDREERVARLSKHLHPTALAQEIEQLGADVPIFLTHAKPGEVQQIVQEVRAFDARHRISHLHSGQEFAL